MVWYDTDQSDDRVDGAVEPVAERAHALVRVRVEIAQDVVLQRRFHLGQVVAHPSGQQRHIIGL